MLATRRTDRQHLEILTLEECLELIDSMPLGRVGFQHDGHQLILPVNHVRLGMLVAFRTAPGAKADASRTAREVAFEVDGHDASTRTGWSVLATGVARRPDAITLSRLEGLDLQPWADGVPRDHWVLIQLRHVTGRRINNNLPVLDQE